MPLLPTLLILAAFASIAVSMLLARAAWPRFKALETRGVIRKPVPDLIEGRTNSFRAFSLLWLTPVPADRPRLKRLVLAYRTSQLLGLALIVTVGIILGTFGSASSAPDRNGPPPVTLSVQDQ